MTSPAILLFALLVSTPSQQDARAEAERLARAGARQQALERFQAIAAENPSDVAARLWIGRLHLEMNQPVRAAAVYESIVATEGQNVDALVGLGLALTRMGQLREASDALARAESIAADRVDVLSAQGALHAAAGRPTLGLAYYGRVLAIEPANAAARSAADALRAARAHRIEFDYDFQTFNDDREDTNTGAVTANLRLSDAVRVFGKAQVHSGQLETESRGGGGLEWLVNRRVSIRGGALFGADTFEMPDSDIFGDLSVRRGRVTWALEGRYLQFEIADLWIGGPRVSVAVQNNVDLFAAYHHGSTSYDSGGSYTSDNFTLGISARVAPRVRTVAEYRHGIDRLDWITVDRIAAGDANTLAFGVSADLTPFVTLDARYAYQSRAEDLNLQRIHAGLVVRF
jgi:tetratricopeptide (TPR) repeat protein